MFIIYCVMQGWTRTHRYLQHRYTESQHNWLKSNETEQICSPQLSCNLLKVSYAWLSGWRNHMILITKTSLSQVLIGSRLTQSGRVFQKQNQISKRGNRVGKQILGVKLKPGWVSGILANPIFAHIVKNQSKNILMMKHKIRWCAHILSSHFVLCCLIITAKQKISSECRTELSTAQIDMHSDRWLVHTGTK